MSRYTPEEYTTHLLRAFAPRCPREAQPRVISDTAEKGEPILEFFLPHPTEPRRSISLTVSSERGLVSIGTLWFGQVEVTGALDPDEAIPAMEEILAGRLIAIARYKTRDAYDNRRKAGTGFVQKLYQLPDDAEAFEAMIHKLRTKAGVWDKLAGSMTGVFEVYSWDTAEIFER